MPAGIFDLGSTPQPGAVGVGFCGKLQTHGDFVQRRLPGLLVRCWEEWLDRSIAASRESLGEDWRALYLTSPIWRFAVSAGCCGDRPFAGVLMPSLDKFGRYHPLTIIAVLEQHTSASAVGLFSSDWYRRIESLALSSLEDDFQFDEFDAKLAMASSPNGTDIRAFGTGFQTVAPAISLDHALSTLIARIIEASTLKYSLWWTVDAGEQFVFSCGYPGLPTPEDFAELLLATTRPAEGAG